jgi:hypothetical protein
MYLSTKFHDFVSQKGVHGAVGWDIGLQSGRSWVRFPMGSLGFFVDFNLLAALWPWGHLHIWQKQVPRMFPGGEGSQCIELRKLPFSCVVCLDILGASTSWSPNGLPRPLMLQLIFIKKYQCYKNYLKSFVKCIWGLKSNQLRRMRLV